jgi:hypothetical protein
MLRSAASPSSAGGKFGVWSVGEAGLPVFNYTMHQATRDYDAAAIFTQRASALPWYGVNGTGVWPRNESEHLFQFGNDRTVLVASNYGSVQMRQDEGGAKFLQDVHPPSAQYGGGLGYLIDDDDGKVVGKTYGEADVREFGVGYARRAAGEAAGVGAKYLEHTVISPYGDDPVAVVEVKVHNLGPSPLSASYYEVWGGSQLQLVGDAELTARGLNTTARECAPLSSPRHRATPSPHSPTPRLLTSRPTARVPLAAGSRRRTIARRSSGRRAGAPSCCAPLRPAVPHSIAQHSIA